MSSTILAFDRPAAARRPDSLWAADCAMILLDIAAILSAASLAILLRYWIAGPYDLGFYLKLIPMALLHPLSLGMAGMYPARGLNPVAELRGLCQAATFTFLCLAAATFFQRDAVSYSRLALLLAWILTMLVSPLLRQLARYLLGKAGCLGARAVILGSGDAGRNLAVALANRPSLGFKVVAVLDAAPGASTDVPSQITGGLELAPALAAETGATYAILAMPQASGSELTALIERYLWPYRHVLILPGLFGISSLDAATRDLAGVLGVEVSHRLMCPAPRLFKRICDLTLAIGGGLLILPLLVLVVVAICLGSSGPVFYASPRIGENGRRFRAWKFRTMVVGATEVLRQHLDQSPELRAEYERESKLRNDPRITWMGRWLRRTSLDELPQLWNVIRGEMSLVGPRPILEHEMPRYGACYQLYKRTRPGLTGLWQVSGRNNTTYAQRLGYVEYYVRNWSVWLDLYILCRTVKVVLTGEGAY
ncbi:undecaprenyl-phosphate galactose phosphotransferase WbaP [Paludibaculum fermentans]|uniref:Undecaprenyl-phosphate galactose phosphotransferase WbaP n=1 Tax=Paludibaculum fermentans TaxID=1473598 RepID=A0A7S7NLY0_PALFE|nr:undecaprenyl-phosphate galactose phosphotransferase WbaP [Paludibaculum fermentans]QOY86042.1 undecaprenyl-phosphate galactose phosphotransferase WbaP [Paludibaculum fermentans]